MNKKQAQIQHAKRRCAERLGVVISRKDIKDMVNRIQQGDGEFVRKQSNRVTLWKMDIAGQEATVVYDKLRKTIVSVIAQNDIRG